MRLRTGLLLRCKYLNHYRNPLPHTVKWLDRLKPVKLASSHEFYAVEVFLPRYTFANPDKAYRTHLPGHPYRPIVPSVFGTNIHTAACPLPKANLVLNRQPSYRSFCYERK